MPAKKKCASGSSSKAKQQDNPLSTSSSTQDLVDSCSCSGLTTPGSPTLEGNFAGPPTKVADSNYLTGSDPEISGDGTDVIKSDGYLEDHRAYFGQRFAHFKRWVRDIELNEGGIDKFSRGYEHFGLHVTEEGVRYREWAPGAREASLVGDFNGWDVAANPLTRNEYGVWETVVPNTESGEVAIGHGSHVKVTFITDKGERVYRLPAWSRYVTQDLSKSPIYESV
ncbi:alpha-1,4-glucan branching enzyme, partial [Coemansia furcata]